LMDDANVPSLLALPIMGFVMRNDPVYRNTRRMLLEKEGNPYFLVGPAFRGIGGMSPLPFPLSFSASLLYFFSFLFFFYLLRF